MTERPDFTGVWRGLRYEVKDEDGVVGVGLHLRHVERVEGCDSRARREAHEG